MRPADGSMAILRTAVARLSKSNPVHDGISAQSRFKFECSSATLRSTAVSSSSPLLHQNFVETLSPRGTWGAVGSVVRCFSSSHTKTSSLEQLLPQPPQRKRRARGLQLEPSRGKNRRLRGYLIFCDQRWDKNFQSLRADVDRIKRKNPDIFPLPDDRHLRMWLMRQRHEYQKRLNGQTSFMTDQRLQKFQSLGYTLQTKRERSWEKVYQQLCAYLNRHNGVFPYDAGNFDSLDAVGQRLFFWCERQRVQYNLFQKEGKSRLKVYMTKERIAKLTRLDFSWSMRESGWDEKYDELTAYYNHHGDCLVPAHYVSNPSLAKWVDTQRRQFSQSNKNKKHNMTDRRFALLNELNFAWDANEARWRLRYNELVEYQNLNGHGMVPRYNDRNMDALHRWLKYQRKAHQKWTKGQTSSMTLKRKEMLDNLGILWMEDY